MDKLSADKLDIFFEQHKHQVYRKGEILIRADDDPLGVFYLKEGIVIEYLISRKGSEAILEFFMPSSIFPLSWAINNAKNGCFFEALFDAKVYRAPREKVVEFLNQNPDVIKDLLSVSCDKVDDFKLRISYAMGGDAYTRVVHELIVVTKAAGIKDKSGAMHLKGFVERYAAARTGLTQETVSREMRKLKENKLVTFAGGTLVIKDLNLLEKELNIF